MPPDSPSISVIVPTLNEAENIEAIIAKILAGAGSLPIEIIVVDDASRDDTQPIVRRLAETLPVILHAREKPRDGLAGAVLAGARAARASVVLVIDADGSHPPEKIPDLALPVIRGERDMVIGSRYAPGGSTPGWSRKRRLMSRAASACAWPLTDVHDALSGFFAVRRDLLASIPSDAAGFKIALEILVRGGDSLRVGEVPIAFRDRELGQSKMGAGVILTYFRRLLALSGWRESQDTVRLAIQKTLLVWAVDFLLFTIAALLLHAGLGEANLFGFAAGAVLNAWLKTAQLPPEASQAPRFVFRLLFVSLLAFFLRSGILGTFAIAFQWPWLAAILPAIVAGWTVHFLGYALFIWPVEDQYGPGLRWRIAAMGATAYLFALRAAFLFTLPIEKQLSALPAHVPDFAIGDRLTVALRHFGESLLGGNRAGLNFPALLCWSVAAWAIFKTAQRIFDKTTAFRALLLFSALPVFFWPGALFSSATVMVASWALVFWGFSVAAQSPASPALFLCILGGSLFWTCGWPTSRPIHSLIGFFLFFPLQALLATPLAFPALLRYERSPQPGMLKTVANISAGIACAFISFRWCAGSIGLAASAAIWIPFLPFIAAGLQRPNSAPARFWKPVIYGCIVCYGIYFSWLAFG